MKDGILRFSTITLTSITASDGANDEAKFAVTLTFSAPVASLRAGDLMVTPMDDPDTADVEEAAAEIGAISVVSLSDNKKWEVEITPVKGMDTTIALAATSQLGMGTTKALTVKTKAGQTPPTAGTLTAAHAAATATAPATTSISAGTIAANGFAVIDYTDLPDLEYFFDIGGTIGLHDTAADTDKTKNSRTVVISEILWGLDFGEVLAMQPRYQFIELYNTTNADIDLKDWKLVFTPGNVRPTIDVDQVSNRGPGGWEVDTGDTGKSGRVKETRADDAASTITPSRIVSMYRNINYDHVEKEAAKATVNRGELVKGIPDGNAKGSWKNSELRETNRWILSTPGRKHIKRTGILAASSVAGSPFIINEIGNDSNGDNDWVELHNLSDSEQSLKNYALTVVTAKGTDTELFDFQGDDWDKRKITWERVCCCLDTASKSDGSRYG